MEIFIINLFRVANKLFIIRGKIDARLSSTRQLLMYTFLHVQEACTLIVNENFSIGSITSLEKSRWTSFRLAWNKCLRAFAGCSQIVTRNHLHPLFPPPKIKDLQ